jgi:uncharacterized membrane protein YkvA (DUF1232 family)
MPGTEPPPKPASASPAERRRKAKRQLLEAVTLLPNLAKLIARLAVSPEVPAREKAILAATVAYLAMPVDLVPDFIPIVGEIDDIYLVALVLQRLINVAGEEVVLKNWDGDPAVLTTLRRTLEAATVFLPKKVREALVGRVSG